MSQATQFRILQCWILVIIIINFVPVVVLVDEPASASVGSTSSNILSPSLASEMESLSLTSDVKTNVITPVSCNSLCQGSLNLSQQIKLM